MSQNSPPPPQQQPPNGPGGPGGPAPKKASPLLPGGRIAIVVLTVLALTYFTYSPHREVSYDDFMRLVQGGEVKKVVVVGTNRAEGEVRDSNSELARELKLNNGKFGVNLFPNENRT